MPKSTGSTSHRHGNGRFERKDFWSGITASRPFSFPLERLIHRDEALPGRAVQRSLEKRHEYSSEAFTLMKGEPTGRICFELEAVFTIEESWYEELPLPAKFAMGLRCKQSRPKTHATAAGRLNEYFQRLTNPEHAFDGPDERVPPCVRREVYEQ